LSMFAARIGKDIRATHIISNGEIHSPNPETICRVL
jgi:hypothetical protein